MRRLLLVAPPSALAFVAAGCGQAPIAKTPVPAGFVCPKVSVAPVGGAHGAPVPGRCRADADCAERADGRCVVIGARGAERAQCAYDVCAGDADCPAGERCVCGTGVGPDRNRCVPGDCHTDADCGGRACAESPSTFVASDYARHVEGHWCRTREDTCASDRECDPEGRRACAYRPELRRWTCVGVTYGGAARE